LSTSGSMASSSIFLESSWQCRSTFYKLTSSKTWTPIGAMGWQLTEIWWNSISTKTMVHSCSTHCLMVFFWKPVHTVLSWMHCKLMVLICLVSQFRVPPSVSWKDRDHWLGRAKKKIIRAAHRHAGWTRTWSIWLTWYPGVQKKYVSCITSSVICTNAITQTLLREYWSLVVATCARTISSADLGSLKPWCPDTGKDKQLWGEHTWRHKNMKTLGTAPGPPYL
jgi:hypothetical protein